jgi:alpha-glucosidase (family GH31 glycosyl hydrolase)
MKLFTWAVLFGIGLNASAFAAIRFHNKPAELVVSEVSERTVRIELLPINDDGKAIPTKPTTALLPVALTEKFRAREISGAKEISLGKMRLTVDADKILIRRDDGAVVQELGFDEGTNGVSFRVNGPVFGLGEGAQQFDRRGALYPMEPGWGAWNRPVLGSVVPSPFIVGSEGWAIFAERPDGQFDLRAGGKFRPANFDEGLDIFVVDVREPSDALKEYNRLTGSPVMPPKWALGYFQSHRTLSGPDEPLQIARTFREKKLPCDAVIYLGTGYCTNGWNTGHGSLSFNPNAFDHPAETLRSLHDLNFKVVLHVNRAPRDLFGASVTEESSSPRHIRNFWTRHHDTFALGVDGWWPDDGDELPLEARLTRHRVYFEGPLQDRPNVRPWSLHRTGYSGAQRYGGWIWSGDIDGKWETLAAQVSVGLNHGLSLTPFWGSDTGGFYPTRELTGELYARWFEFSAFCPSFRSHGRTWHLRLPWGWNTGEMGPIEDNDRTDRAELHNAEVEPICRKYLELRYRLLPYNYTLAREACDTGLPMMRALWLHYPGDPEATKLGSEYLWGRDLLVAPVVEKGARSRRVYLPAGRWTDFWTNESREGAQWIDRAADLGTLPLYVRAGTILPLDPVRQFTSQPVNEPTTLRIFPGANGSFTLYDDDGQSLDYKTADDAKAVWIQFRWDDSAKRLTAQRGERMKSWTAAPRKFAVEIVGSGKSQPLEFRGEPVTLAF